MLQGSQFNKKIKKFQPHITLDFGFPGQNGEIRVSSTLSSCSCTTIQNYKMGTGLHITMHYQATYQSKTIIILSRMSDPFSCWIGVIGLTLVYPRGVVTTPLRIILQPAKTLNFTIKWVQLIVGSSFPAILAQGKGKLSKLGVGGWLPPCDIRFCS